MISTSTRISCIVLFVISTISSTALAGDPSAILEGHARITFENTDKSAQSRDEANEFGTEDPSVFSQFRLNPEISAPSRHDNNAAPQYGDLENFGYFLTPSMWPASRGTTIVFVCWENASPRFVREMEWVQRAASSSWQEHSGLAFRGWRGCAETSDGIRILIEDTGPHVKQLGAFLNGRPAGMVLNFTFQNWSPSCARNESARERCIRSIAVHEFGHATGFAHEHNRWDTPGECTLEPQGTDGDVMLTPYDASSVMNYCNPVYNNNGSLSLLDVASVQAVYGKPQ
ncbi:hypothetical protein VQ045_20130 [Aurantimonas sp. E1-2-R+4]|uniref:hypothetical protein n=1 Tax=Aurantimonas sp. E1-2-R+4 TaxID=3113714 RepID=UPI002F93766A